MVARSMRGRGSGGGGRSQLGTDHLRLAYEVYEHEWKEQKEIWRTCEFKAQVALALAAGIAAAFGSSAFAVHDLPLRVCLVNTALGLLVVGVVACVVALWPRNHELPFDGVRACQSALQLCRPASESEAGERLHAAYLGLLQNAEEVICTIQRINNQKIMALRIAQMSLMAAMLLAATVVFVLRQA